MRNFKKIFIVTLISAVAIPVIVSHATSKKSDLSPYENELQILNSKWGTQYTLVKDEHGSYKEILNMTLEQFDKYMEDIHELDQKNPAEFGKQ